MFQFLFTLVAPIVDIMLLWTLLSSLVAWNMDAVAGMPATLQTVLIYWMVFQLVEIATAVLAIAIDRRDGIWRLLPLLFVQRFVYRQLLYVTAIQVTMAALKGTMQGWGKLNRTGHVTTAELPDQRIAA